MDKIIEYMKKRPEGGDISDSDQQAIRGLIKQEMQKERDVLSKQVVALMNPGMDVSSITYENLRNYNERPVGIVDRLGFFKYGHLMSQQDVDELGKEDLKNDYQCIKIQEENVMENIDQVSAIWGTVNPNYAIELEKARGELEKAQGTIQTQGEKIACLEQQIKELKQSTPNKRLIGRRSEPARQKKNNPPQKKNNPPAKQETPSRSASSDFSFTSSE
jgi:hypothetical protein